MERSQDLRRRSFHVKTMWECEWRTLQTAKLDVRTFVDKASLLPPLQPQNAFFRGLTDAAWLYYAVNTQCGEEIRYVDYTSLYLWVNKYSRYPIGHPTFLYEPGTTDLSSYFHWMPCSIPSCLIGAAGNSPLLCAVCLLNGIRTNCSNRHPDPSLPLGTFNHPLFSFSIASTGLPFLPRRTSSSFPIT